MNFVFISPHFPPNFYKFCTQLKNSGINVLGIADESYDNLKPELKYSLTEYYKVDNMEDYSQILKACGYFTHKYGKIDRIESNNEYWLERDAKLRTDFNVFGIKEDEIADMKLKSKMKAIFKKAGIDVVNGSTIETLKDAEDFTNTYGYPVVVKPDNGVGAANTYKISNHDDLKNFFQEKPDKNYFIEQFVDGSIETFDGLTDKDGNPVFTSSLVYGQAVMDSVNEGLDMSYYIPRVIPDDIIEAGTNTVKAFGLKERFFHFEYFRTKENKIIGLEVNVRPPGGLTIDMFNYANDIDIFKEYANILLYNKFYAKLERKYFCFYVGRKNSVSYQYSKDDILSRYWRSIIHHEQIYSVFAAAIGDYGFIIRTEQYEEGKKILDDILLRK